MNQAEFKVKPWGFWSTFGLSFCIWAAFAVIQTLVAIGAMAIYSLQTGETNLDVLVQNLASDGLVLAIATLASTPICIGLIFLFIRLRKGSSITTYLQLGKLNRRTIINLVVWNVITVGFIYVVDFLKSFISRDASTFTLDIYKSAQVLPLLYVAIVVAAPLFEEIFFRGFMFQGFLHSKLGAIGTVFITSAIWAVIHSQYDPYDMTGIFLFGILLAIAQLFTRCLYVPISMHALNNLLALISVASQPR